MTNLFHRPTGVHFNYNADFSGDVRVELVGNFHISIPASALLALFTEYVRARRVEELGDASLEQLLFLPTGRK